MTGGLQVVSVAAVVVAVPQLFVKTARYLLPLTAGVTVTVNEVLVSPGMLLKMEPPSVLTCHCTVGAGLPFAAAVNVTVPLFADCETGFSVTTGAVFTVRVAFWLALPHAPVTVTATVCAPALRDPVGTVIDALSPLNGEPSRVQA